MSYLVTGIVCFVCGAACGYLYGATVKADIAAIKAKLGL